MTLALPLRPTPDFFDLPLGTIAGAVREAIVLVDMQQRIVAVHSAAVKMFGRSKADLLSQPLSLLIPIAQRATLALHMLGFADAGKEERVVCHPWRRDRPGRPGPCLPWLGCHGA